MGASLDRVQVLPTGDGSEADIKAGFAHFDVQHAQCFMEGERQKILGIIESGFGSADAFNAIVSTMLRARGSRVRLTSSELQDVSMRTKRNSLVVV
jgi:hypothetical protein